LRGSFSFQGVYIAISIALWNSNLVCNSDVK
jgi:hypothetical protein